MPAPKKSAKSSPAKSEKAQDKAVTPPPPSIYIDPSHSASSVAASLAARAKQGGTSPAAKSGAADSSAFKKFKDSVGKPQFSAGSPLAAMGQQSKFAGPSGFAKQTGHSQTNAAGAARTGVPRRTSGG